MTDRDESQDSRRRGAGKKTASVSQSLVAAVSLLGISLGVSAAAPTDGSAKGQRSEDAGIKLAGTKLDNSSIHIVEPASKFDASPQGKLKGTNSGNDKAFIWFEHDPGKTGSKNTVSPSPCNPGVSCGTYDAFKGSKKYK